ncbi:lipoyl synthase [bacterium (candidate division B38) B3_B38]|nr:MAG: lipoyl synthase [bacterium (candidate division B38) B3_B38]
MPRYHPSWLKVKLPTGEKFRQVNALIKKYNLHTVCRSALCPNKGECFSRGVATFMILGDVCTRRCRFCNVTKGSPSPMDEGEARRVAQAVSKLGLRHAVVTSVTRDDLPDGGASLFAATITAIRALNPGCRVEVLVPDFKGSAEALSIVLRAKPDILNHNMETVERLYALVRPGADYARSLNLLHHSKRIAPTILTKSGLMVGLGEQWEEIITSLENLRGVDCNMLTIGQYLQPSKHQLPVSRYYTPEEFAELRETARKMGFRNVASAPLVRSSYQADLQFSAT